MAAKDFSQFVEIKKTIESEKIAQIQIHNTKEYNLASELYKATIQKLKQELGQIEEIVLNGFEVEASTFHAELSTIPMFESARVVWLKHGNEIFNKIAANKTLLSYFVRDFENIPKTTFIVIHFDGYKVPKNLDVIHQKAWVFNLKPMNEKDLVQYLSNRIQQLGFSAEQGVVNLIAEKSAWESKQAMAALDRLFSFCLHEKKINLHDVNEVCHDLEGDFYFKLLDLLASRRVKQVLSSLNQQKISDGAFFLGGFIKLYTNALRYHYMKKAGLSPIDIHERLGLNAKRSFIFNKNEERFSKIFENYKLSELKLVIKNLCKLEQQMKENPKLHQQRTLLTMFVAII